ncbi:hypothetical protein L218DRAFT_274325 [Marasmius fiardii PR-910]|nr:hypothetical protein L218DRAFT_274325 [Marasmius fiardii PR-910]
MQLLGRHCALHRHSYRHIAKCYVIPSPSTLSGLFLFFVAHTGKGLKSLTSRGRLITRRCQLRVGADLRSIRA